MDLMVERLEERLELCDPNIDPNGCVTGTGPSCHICSCL